MKTLMLVLVLVTSNAFAIGYKEMSSSFTISSRTDAGMRTYYNCDSVEDRVESMLETMGASVHRVRCIGGINRWNPSLSTDAHVVATYSALSNEVQDGNMTVAISNERIRSNDSCHMINSAFNSLKANFELSGVKMRRCSRTRSRTSISFDVLKETK
jgi:hypothetical protein